MQKNSRKPSRVRTTHMHNCDTTHTHRTVTISSGLPLIYSQKLGNLGTSELVKRDQKGT